MIPFSFLLPLFSNWQRIALYAGIAVALFVAGNIRGCVNEREAFTNYKAKVEAAGEVAQKEAERKDKENETRIKTATTERDAALARLRNSTHPSRVSSVPTAPAGSSEVCFPTSVYNRAFGEFGQSLNRRLADAHRDATEGDAAQIDAQSLLRAWPQ